MENKTNYQSKNQIRISKMLAAGYSVSEIASVLRIPSWKITQIVQAEFAKAMLSTGGGS